MKNFKEDGHISKEGFLKMQGNQCTTLERLELTEHISFCNPCLEQYLALVEEGKILTPQRSMQQAILQKAQKNRFGDFRKRFGQATMAASVFLMCWSIGGNVVGMEYSLSCLTKEASVVTDKMTKKLDTLTGKTLDSYWKLLGGEYEEDFKDGKE